MLDIDLCYGSTRRNTMEHSHDVREELRGPALALRELIPDVMKGYAELSRAAMVPGELSTGVKELLALMVAVTRQCDGCVVAHTRGAARAGVSRAMVAEAMGVAILMNGGPGTVWGPRALRSFDEAVEDRASR
jgi:AhpD family alkylhydroperoxidase